MKMEKQMKRICCFLLALILFLPALTLAELEEEELGIDDLEIEEFDPDEEIPTTEAKWNFPVALEDMNPEFVVLANKHYKLSSKFVPNPLVKMKQRKANKDGSNKNGGVLFAEGGTYKLQETCAEALVAMSEGARADGYKLFLKSAYRSYGQQASMWERRYERNNYKDDGWVAKAGASDHQTGLGCDVVPQSWRKKPMNGKMGKEPECIWMAEHCHEYGFILRYPADKEEITEINYEPWHMRYVGIPAATYIMENGLCLEEFTEQLQQAIQDYMDAGGDPAKVEAYIQKPTEE